MQLLIYGVNVNHHVAMWAKGTIGNNIENHGTRWYHTSAYHIVWRSVLVCGDKVTSVIRCQNRRKE